MRRTAALTLMELMVVLAIMGLLMVLMIPRLGRAVDRAQASGCLSNLRQWGLATHLFAADHDDFLPKDGSSNGRSRNEGWYVDLPRQLGIATYHAMPWHTNKNADPGRSIWICPANQRRSNGQNLFHYCLNRSVNGTGVDNQVRLTTIPKPTATVWMFDNGKLAAVARQNNVHTNLHARGAHFVFLDGHARHFPNPDYWDFERGCGRTNHPALIWIP